ncbi:conserved hypothetical protein [Chloroherpeton thalassium ATCC 35110]|uniref:Secretory lipase n=1 Tax=Chloroherpeton thalassium (strain ATCC 35110 / GB-78) TaxID=517418 RepID=B3QUS4_CHLT3|nr:lipase family protein [Chloroherpeton thalassium]ACF14425.1 conserved hypothetical protein [Chloroherpeton thalassium ATCC 35110]
MKHVLCHLFFIAFLFSAEQIPAREIDPGTAAMSRGLLLTDSLMRTATTAEIQAIFNLRKVDFTAIYSVTAYKLVYLTIDVNGNTTRASGVISLPDTLLHFPLLSYQHGTIMKDSEAISRNGSENFLSLGLASIGNIVIASDYLGLGESAGLHPYVHAKSLASASLDFLKAAKTFLAKKNRAVTDSLFLMGYSEGGYATIALQKEIEEHYSSEYQIVASAPMAGPYDLSGIMKSFMLNGKSHPSPAYVPYVVLAYNEIYGLFHSLREVFIAPYDSLLPTLFDGSKNTIEVNIEIPSAPKALFQDSFIAEIKNNQSHPINQALMKNDIYNWKPISPTTLYHSLEDDNVPYENSVKAYEQFVKNGATSVRLDTLHAGKHTEAAIPIMLKAMKWFKTFQF